MREPSFILQILGMILVIWYLGNYAIKEGMANPGNKKLLENMKKQERNNKLNNKKKWKNY